MHPEIRKLGPGDESVLDRVAQDVFDEPVRAERLAAYLAEPGHHMIVAIVDGEVVGQCAAVVHRHPDKVTELYIDEVGVTPAFQRQGIARKMLEEMFSLGKALGCEEAWVGTEPDNLPARGLYEAARGPPRRGRNVRDVPILSLTRRADVCRLRTRFLRFGRLWARLVPFRPSSSQSRPCISVSRDAVRANSNPSVPRLPA